MFDFSWGELAVIAIVALVVIPPRDLPKTLRTAGIWMRRAKALAREFQNSIDEMVREAELDEFRRSLEAQTRIDFGEPPKIKALPPDETGQMSLALTKHETAASAEMPADAHGAGDPRAIGHAAAGSEEHPLIPPPP